MFMFVMLSKLRWLVGVFLVVLAEGLALNIEQHVLVDAEWHFGLGGDIGGNIFD